MAHAPKLLVIDGYTREAREQLVEGGASTASDLYVQMLIHCGPEGTRCDVLFPSDEGVALPGPRQLKQYDGVAWTGCSLSVNDAGPQVEGQIQIVRDCFVEGIPGFGSCWAAQIAVVAAGGRVEPNPHGREMGIARKIGLTRAGMEHPLYTGKQSLFDGFTSHDEHITRLPEGAVALAGNAWTPIQSVAVRHQAGEFWGLQYHPEYDLHEMARLTYCRIEKLVRLGFFATPEEARRYVGLLETLHENRSRKDIAWLLGIDDDVMGAGVRQLEVRNWLNKLVLPTMEHRHAMSGQG
jgi:GMP synthase (glutamine-hydrolysing)